MSGLRSPARKEKIADDKRVIPIAAADRGRPWNGGDGEGVIDVAAVDIQRLNRAVIDGSRLEGVNAIVRMMIELPTTKLYGS